MNRLSRPSLSLNEKDSSSIASSANSTTGLIYNEKAQAQAVYNEKAHTPTEKRCPAHKASKTKIGEEDKTTTGRTVPQWPRGNMVGKFTPPPKHLGVSYEVVYPPGYDNVTITEATKDQPFTGWISRGLQSGSKCPVIAGGNRMLSWMKDPFRDVIDDFFITRMSPDATAEEKARYHSCVILCKNHCARKDRSSRDKFVAESYAYYPLKKSEPDTTIIDMLTDIAEKVRVLQLISNWVNNNSLGPRKMKEHEIEPNSDMWTCWVEKGTQEQEDQLASVKESEELYLHESHNLAKLILVYHNEVNAIARSMASHRKAKSLRHYRRGLEKFTELWYDQEVANANSCRSMWLEGFAKYLKDEKRLRELVDEYGGPHGSVDGLVGSARWFDLERGTKAWQAILNGTATAPDFEDVRRECRELCEKSDAAFEEQMWAIVRGRTADRPQVSLAPEMQGLTATCM